MTLYIVICITISGIVATALLLLKSTPARIRLYLSLLAITVWLVPWGEFTSVARAIAQPSSFDISVPDIQGLNNSNPKPSFKIHTAKRKYPATPPPMDQTAFSLDTPANQYINGLLNKLHTFIVKFSPLILCTALLMGLYLFAKDLLFYRKTIRHMKQNATDGKDWASELGFKDKHLKVRLVPKLGTGLATGLANPTAWIDADIAKQQWGDAILLHEVTHIRQKDIYWIWFVALTKRLFWWNYLVQMFCKKARDYIELSCDEICDQYYPDGYYASSLARVTLMKNQSAAMKVALNMTSESRIDIMRLKELDVKKSFEKIHCSILSFLFFISFYLISAAIYHSTDFGSQLTFNQRDGYDRARSNREHAEARVSDRALRFAEVLEHLISSDYQTAHAKLYQIKTDFTQKGTFNFHARRAWFRYMAIVLAEQEKFEEIIQQHDTLLAPKTPWDDRLNSRIVAIAHIKLGQLNEALDILLKSEKNTGEVVPTSVLIAQTLHLQGKYKASNDRLFSVLEISKHIAFDHIRIAIFRLLGKNGVILGDNQLVEKARFNLGDLAPKDFMVVKANAQIIPLVYLPNQTISGIDIGGFDEAQFPMPILTPGSNNPAFVELIEDATSLAKNKQYYDALELLSHSISNNELQFTEQERTRAHEYLFMIALATKNKSTVGQSARLVLDNQEIHPSIRSRAYYVLSTDPKHSNVKNLHYFHEYLSMLNKPSFAADHELIKRYYKADDVSPAKEAAYSVSALYDKKGIVPDIKTLNRLIGAFDTLGDTANAKKYQNMLITHYPRATNFIFEVL